MFRNNSNVPDPCTARTHFPLREIAGRWVSPGGSPEVRIVFTGTRYRLEFSYDAATVFTCPIRHQWGVTFFYLYGRIRISYDAERDVLILSDYGEYIRADEE
ncbi:hypothetical protein AGMMS50239_00320 [Bacteroidia bacterium]|nr:hypothetical protein AGMMS50239_00320 [Bacteroidia bacterium]